MSNDLNKQTLDKIDRLEQKLQQLSDSVIRLEGKVNSNFTQFETFLETYKSSERTQSDRAFKIFSILLQVCLAGMLGYIATKLK